MPSVSSPVFLHFFSRPNDPLGIALAAAGWIVVSVDCAFADDSPAVSISPEDARSNPKIVVDSFRQLFDRYVPIGPNAPDAPSTSTTSFDITPLPVVRDPSGGSPCGPVASPLSSPNCVPHVSIRCESRSSSDVVPPDVLGPYGNSPAGAGGPDGPAKGGGDKGKTKDKNKNVEKIFWLKADLSNPHVLDAFAYFIRWLASQPRPASAPYVSWLGPRCSNFSNWMHAVPWWTRSRDNPWGTGVHPKERQANAVLRAALKLTEHLDPAAIDWYWEQPQTSLHWHVPQLVRRLRARPHFTIVFDWCRYAKPYRKTTTVAGRAPALNQLAKRCRCTTPHVVLQGAAGGIHGQKRMTAIAGEYGREWCQQVARALSAHYRP